MGWCDVAAAGLAAFGLSGTAVAAAAAPSQAAAKPLGTQSLVAVLAADGQQAPDRALGVGLQDGPDRLVEDVEVAHFDSKPGVGNRQIAHGISQVLLPK